MAAYHWLYHYLLQAQGRGRAEDSSYTLVEVKNSGVAEKEHVNEYRKNMMNKAIAKIRALDQADYDRRVLQTFWSQLNWNPRCGKTVLSDVCFVFFIRSQSFRFRLSWRRRWEWQRRSRRAWGTRARLRWSSAADAAANTSAPAKTLRSSKTCTESMLQHSLGTNYSSVLHYSEPLVMYKWYATIVMTLWWWIVPCRHGKVKSNTDHYFFFFTVNFSFREKTLLFKSDS